MPRFINPVPQYFTANGAPLVSGHLHFYDSGSATYKTVWVDSDRTTPAQNPLPLYGDGRVPSVFLNGAYRVVLTDQAGSTVWERDPVSGNIDAPFGADWDSNTAYRLNDVVKENDLYWVSQTTSNIGNRPSTDGGTNWQQAVIITSQGDVRYGPIVETAAKLRALESIDGGIIIPSTEMVAYLLGIASSGVGAGEFIYDPADTTTVDDGFSTIVDTSGGRWKRASVSGDHTGNYTDNPYFMIFDRGDPVLTTGVSDKYVCARWRIKKTNAADVVTASQNDAWAGGLSLDITAGASETIYVRQLQPDLQRFSKKILTFLVDVENDTAGLTFDWYALMRYNANDLERVVVVDSPQFSLPVGRGMQLITVQVPDIDDQVYALDSKNSLESAFRIFTSGGAVSGANVIIHSFHILDGAVSKAICEGSNPASIKSRYDEEYTALYYYEDTGFISVNGLNNSGRQRVQIPMASRKRLGVSGTYTVYDAVGNAGKISTYDSAGARTDNVTPVALTPRKNSFEVIYTSAGSTGIGAQVIADCEF